MTTATDCPVVMTRFAHRRKDTMNIRTEKFPRPPDKRETAAPDGTGNGGEVRKHHTNNANRNAHNQQAACRAIEAGLVYLPDACDMAFILRRRLDLRQRTWLAASAMLALPADTAEQLSEAVLHDLRAGPPVPPFMSIREAAMSWAAFASRPEKCHYLAAVWDRLSDNDRTRFLRRAI
jgi:hypothetical protein